MSFSSTGRRIPASGLIFIELEAVDDLFEGSSKKSAALAANGRVFGVDGGRGKIGWNLGGSFEAGFDAMV